ncbi:MAG: hypothetical protein V9F04_08845 [Dermatophilaceae bacterium]
MSSTFFAGLTCAPSRSVYLPATSAPTLLRATLLVPWCLAFGAVSTHSSLGDLPALPLYAALLAAAMVLREVTAQAAVAVTLVGVPQYLYLVGGSAHGGAPRGGDDAPLPAGHVGRGDAAGSPRGGSPRGPGRDSPRRGSGGSGAHRHPGTRSAFAGCTRATPSVGPSALDGDGQAQFVGADRLRRLPRPRYGVGPSRHRGHPGGLAGLPSE